MARQPLREIIRGVAVEPLLKFRICPRSHRVFVHHICGMMACVGMGQCAWIKKFTSVILSKVKQPPLAESVRLRAVLSATLRRLLEHVAVLGHPAVTLG